MTRVALAALTAAAALPLSRGSWLRRLLQPLTTYLPLLLMGVLALGTWWLVKNTPLLLPEGPAKALRHEPDYTMHQFSVHRFAKDGRLKAQIEGDTLRHYPDDDTVEIDRVRLRAIGPGGTVTRALAKQALSNGDGSEVQLTGSARVERDAQGSEEAAVFTSDFLHAFLNTEEVRSHLPVVLQRGSTQITGDSLDYDNLNRVVSVNGRVKATFAQPVETSKPDAPGRKP
jgi:lipopolysaccharide export system protein LptC